MANSGIGLCHVMRYYAYVIKTFADKRTKTLYESGKAARVAAAITSRAQRKLDLLNEASEVEDMRVPPSNRLHRLEGDRKGQWSVSINDQSRICFHFEGGNAYDVEFCDYH